MCKARHSLPPRFHIRLTMKLNQCSNINVKSRVLNESQYPAIDCCLLWNLQPLTLHSICCFSSPQFTGPLFVTATYLRLGRCLLQILLSTLQLTSVLLRHSLNFNHISSFTTQLAIKMLTCFPFLKMEGGRSGWRDLSIFCSLQGLSNCNFRGLIYFHILLET